LPIILHISYTTVDIRCQRLQSLKVYNYLYFNYLRVYIIYIFANKINFLIMQIYKAKDPAHHIFFALRVQKDSLAMQLLKSCPIRYWDTNLKVWLIPYSIDNWKILQNKSQPYLIPLKKKN